MFQNIYALVVAILLTSFGSIYSQIVINEVCSKNASMITDEYGDTPDWIELYNTDTQNVDIAGYYISDDPANLQKYQFPSVVIPPNGYLIVFASGKNVVDTYIHTNFKIKQEGETIVLSNPTSPVIDSVSGVYLRHDHSYGCYPDGSTNHRFFETPSPNSSNNVHTAYNGYVSTPSFSNEGGFFTSSTYTLINTNTVNATIRYSVDGRTPDMNSPTYDNLPIVVTATQAIKARAFASGLIPSEVITSTYLINENGIGELPVISITTAPDNLWGDSGIYVTGTNSSVPNFTQDWEIDAHIEYYGEDELLKFEQNVGIQIYGDASRFNPMKSLKLFAREEYGASTIDFPLFEDKPEINSYKRIVLRNAGNEFNQSHLRDGAIHKLLLRDENVDLDLLAYKPVVVYLNGVYWGVHNMRESTDKHYLAGNHTINPDSVTILSGGSPTAIQGNLSDFDVLYNYILDNDMNQYSVFDSIEQMIDLKSYCDYFICETYLANVDWPEKNLKFWKSNSNGKWRYIFYDLDATLNYVGSTQYTVDVLSNLGSSSVTLEHSIMFNRLLQNDSFKVYFINRYADLMNTTFTPDNFLSVLDEATDNIHNAMYLHFDKWPGNTHSNWLNVNVYTGVKSFITNRPQYARSAVEHFFTMNKQVSLTLKARKNRGKIKINTILLDEFPWEGIYFDGAPVTLEATPSNGYQFTYWTFQNNSDTLYNPIITRNFDSDEIVTAHFKRVWWPPLHTDISNLDENQFIVQNDIVKGGLFPPVVDTVISDPGQGKKELDPSLDDLEDDLLFSLYPNPAKDHVFLLFDSGPQEWVKVNIFNTEQKLVRKLFFTDIEHELIDLSTLGKGCYLMFVETNQGRSVKKIVF